jgi:predicted Rossmann-fold nucleotide-binding protein
MIERIISGGQTGADRAALDAAIDCGTPHGGWCPAGRIASDGTIPEDYNLRETEESTYPPRTERNVKEADATVVFMRGPGISPGSKLTIGLCEKHKKPFTIVNVAITGTEDAAMLIKYLVQEYKVRTLNVAGSRENKSPGIYFLTYEAVSAMLKDDK